MPQSCRIDKTDFFFLALFDDGLYCFFQRQAGGFPQRLLFGVGAAVVTTRNEYCFCRSNFFKGFGGVGDSLYCSRVFLGAQDDKIIMHDRIALGSITFLNKFLFPGFGMHKYNIDIAVHTVPNGRSGAFGNDFDLNIRILFKFRQKDVQQSRCLSTGCCGHLNNFFPCQTIGAKKANHQTYQNNFHLKPFHQFLLFICSLSSFIRIRSTVIYLLPFVLCHLRPDRSSFLKS